jgi:preprotein translocase YajC subunit
MQEFLNMYGPYMLLAIFLIYLIGVNIYRTKKYSNQAKALVESLKVGDYVKTYSGFYGTISAVEQKTLANGQVEKVVVLELSDNNFITLDANAVYLIANDLKPKVKKTPTKPSTPKTAKTTKTKKEEEK